MQLAQFVSINVDQDILMVFTQVFSSADPGFSNLCQDTTNGLQWQRHRRPRDSTLIQYSTVLLYSDSSQRTSSHEQMPGVEDVSI